MYLYSLTGSSTFEIRTLATRTPVNAAAPPHSICASGGPAISAAKDVTPRKGLSKVAGGNEDNGLSGKQHAGINVNGGATESKRQFSDTGNDGDHQHRQYPIKYLPRSANRSKECS